jgi:WD40 repeat protein
MSDTTQGANGRVFISYSRKDKPFVQKLNDALDQSGVQAWVDWEGIELASDWMKTITEAIQSNDAFLFIISPDSLNSKVCADELEMGLKLNKKLIPILYREPEKGSTMHNRLASTNWVYMRDQDNFEDTLPKLIQSVNTDLGWVRKHTRLLEQAMEWQEANRNNSFLLNGTELQDAEQWVAQASGHTNRQIVPVQSEYIVASRKFADRRQRTLLAGVSLALVVSIILSVMAWIARNDAKAAQNAALTSEAIAISNQHTASTAEAVAEENQKIAEQKKQEAEEKTNLAIANRSAAQSQIFQSRPGELDTSTLLAIDSYQRLPSFQAEDLIRTNSSKMALPLKQMSQDGPIWNIEWNPDTTAFVTANQRDPGNSASTSKACVWSANDGKNIFCVQHQDDVNDALFTPDGKYLVTASADKTVRFWDAVTGKPDESKTLTFDGAVNDLDVSDFVLAIAREDGFLTLYYLNKPDLKPVSRDMGAGVYEVKFSNDHNLLAIGLNNGEVKLWQARQDFFYNGAKHPNSSYVVVAFSPDSNWLVSGGGDSMSRLTRRDGTVQYQVPHGDWVEDVAFGADPSWYVTVSDDNKVRVLDTATGAEKSRMSHTGFAQRVRVSPDGQWIASTGYDNVVRVWDSASGSQMLEIPIDANGTAIAFNQDGTRLIAANKIGTISLWDISMLTARLSYIEFPEFVHEARFTPSGEFLLVNSDDYHIWKIPASDANKIKKGSEGRSIFTAQTLTYNTAISPDSKWVAAVEYDSGDAQSNRGRLVSLDGATQYPLDHGGRVTSVAFDNKSKYAITTGSNGLISFWDVTTGKQIEEFKLENGKPAFSLSADPVDSLVATGLRGSLKIWDYKTHQLVTELRQTGEISALVFSNDGKWLAAGGEGTIKLWNVEARTFTEAGNLQLEGKPQTLAFSPDDTVLAGGSSSGFAYLWNTSTREEVSRIPHSDPVTSVSFSLDGAQLFTVSRKVVRIWDVKSIRRVPREQLISFACAHLVANLSQSAWTLFFGDEQYRLICPNLPEPEL